MEFKELMNNAHEKVFRVSRGCVWYEWVHYDRTWYNHTYLWSLNMYLVIFASIDSSKNITSLGVVIRWSVVVGGEGDGLW